MSLMWQMKITRLYLDQKEISAATYMGARGRAKIWERFSSQILETKYYTILEIFTQYCHFINLNDSKWMKHRR